LSVLDVRARDDPGRQFLLEMQRLLQPALAKRLLFYWAGGHASQLFQGDRYEQLQPTYSICLLDEPLVHDARVHHIYRPFDSEHGVLLCNDLEVHLLELSKFDLPADAVRTPLGRWLYFFRHGASLDPGSLPATLDVPVIRQAVEVLVKISQDEVERNHYQERQRAERDAANLVAEARVAEQRGVEKGEVIGRIRLLQRLLGQSQTASAELRRQPLEDLLQEAAALERQHSGPNPANGSPPAEKT
jgi:predicted transposase/invertase (TIGR01784 family)